MVSTRGVRYKFSEGERVLCYEPDPTKAKVLYDSKVLEVIESKDRRGRRTIEYLIHFQGWNSSWDRCVSEDFVLKDTEENRQLQRDLADKAQLQLGAYLYRRERKKGSGSSTPGGTGGTVKRARLGFSDDGSSSSTQPEGEPGDTDSSGEAPAPTPKPATPPQTGGRAHINLPSALRDRLTFDYHLVVKRGRLSRLPAKPCAAEILEAFVKWFARAGAWHPPRSRHDPPQKPDLMDVSRRLNLVREVADGLRVYFDFILRGHLLYRQEQEQYHDVCGKFLDAQETENHEIVFKLANAEDILKSPKCPEYSHLPPDPRDPFKNIIVEASGQVTVSNHRSIISPEEVRRAEAAEKAPPPPPPCAKTEPPTPQPQPVKTETAEEATAVPASVGAPTALAVPTALPAPTAPAASTTAAVPTALTTPAAPTKIRDIRAVTRAGTVARRLRSHKSAVSQSETEEPAPSTSLGERILEAVSSSVGSSGSSLSEGWARPAQAAAAAPTPSRTPLSLLLEKVANWEIIPRKSTEHLPCRVYGAVHLSRLFVKLPEFLGATQMPEFKLKLILKHIDMFVQFLDEHNEWFGENYYIADTTSRSH